MPQHLTFDHLIRVGETLPIAIDYKAELGTDTIASSTWTVPTGTTQAAATTTGTIATLWLTGTTEGTAGAVTNTLTSIGGKVLVRRVTIRVKG